jgi:hypothetical protein
MAKNSVKIEGLDELIRDLAGFGDRAMPYIIKASNEAGDIVLQRAKARVPSKSGDLRDNLQLQQANNKYKNVAFSKVIIPSNVAYGVPLELGHKIRNRKNGPVYGQVKERPFLRPAADESKAKVREIVKESMYKAMEELGDKRV